MILTIDVGNTNIVFAGFSQKNDGLLFLSRISTQTALTADEYAVKFLDILRLYGFNSTDIEGAIISNVVTPISSVIKGAVKRLSDKKILVVGPGIKTGLNIKIDNPAVLGSDLVCGAVSAMEKYSPPCIIFELGTATVISAIDKNRHFLGASIIPGVMLSLKALSSAAAQLPDINTELSGDILIGTNTVEAMQSGSIIGTACMIDGMTMRFKEIIGEDANVVATGAIAATILPFCRENIILDETLIVDGLYAIYKRNQ